MKYCNFATLLLLFAALPTATAENWCGTVFGNAVKCEKSCPTGVDSECPSGEYCFAGVSCGSKRDDAYCGTSFGEAHTCSTPCYGGTDEECGGDTCFGSVSCGNTNRNRCGTSYEDANTNCGTTCPGGLDGECGSGESCYATEACPENDPPPSTQPGDGNGCFSAKATVEVKEKGMVAMKDLQVGDQVLTMKGSAVGYETVYAFGHRDPNKTFLFLQLYTTSSERPLEISPKHLIYLKGKSNPVTAESLRVGDVLVGTGEAAVVRKITTVTRQDGIFAPLTPSGTIVVNGFLASNYVSLQKHHSQGTDGDEYPKLANDMLSLPWSQHGCIHMVLSPLRLACVGVSPALCSYFVQDGKPLFVKAGMELAEFAQEKNSFWLQLVLCALVILVCFPIYMVEVLTGGPGLPAVVLVGIPALLQWLPSHSAAVHGKIGRNRKVV